MFSGLQPGEKLFEELLADADRTLASGHSRLRIARLDASDGGRLLADLADGFGSLGANPAGAEIKRWLRRHVGEYRPC